MQVDLGSGTSIYAYTGGRPFDAALPCIVFIHGALNDHSVWTLAARYFAHHGHAVLAVDLPGHGRSAGAPPASIETAAQDLLAMLDAAGVRQAAWVGHSMGSLIALEAAARTPHRATHLVMVGTAYPMKVSDALLQTALDSPGRAIDMVNAWSHSGWGAKPSYPGPGAWLHGGSSALMHRLQDKDPSFNLFHHDFGLCNGYAMGLEAAARVTCPAAVVTGQRDQMTTPRQSSAIAAALRARTWTVSSGHALMAEAPDALLTALREALDAQ